MLTLELPSASQGHNTLTIDDDKPEQRVELAQAINLLLKQGTLVFVIRDKETYRITGYAAMTNEWVLHRAAAAELKKARLPAAKDDKATAVPQTAGG